MLGRREFIKGLAAAAGAWAVPQDSGADRAGTGAHRTGAPAHASGTSRVALDPVGLQLYTVRREMARDFDATLATVAGIGYREVEFAGYYDRSPAQVRSALTANGLAAPATHIGLDEIEADPERVFATAKEIGHQYVVVPSLPRERRNSLDALRRTAAAFNDAGRRAQAAGLRFGFHNHAAEFTPVEGSRPFDVLLEGTEPGLVWFELDLFWIRYGGADPLAYFERWPGRFPMVHVKDMDDSTERRMVDVGAGAIDFRAIFARADQAGIRHYFVEHDNPADPIASIRASFTYLRDL